MSDPRTRFHSPKCWDKSNMDCELKRDRMPAGSEGVMWLWMGVSWISPVEKVIYFTCNTPLNRHRFVFTHPELKWLILFYKVCWSLCSKYLSYNHMFHSQPRPILACEQLSLSWIPSFHTQTWYCHLLEINLFTCGLCQVFYQHSTVFPVAGVDIFTIINKAEEVKH